MSVASPLSMRLLFVSGKGGVGKTTISAALALAASKRGKRVLLVEVGPQESFSRMFGATPGGHSENPVAENIWALNLHPFQALEEYLETQLPSRRLVRMIAGNPLFKQLVEVAPGFRDLITLGKIWHLETQRDPKTNRPRYDLIIVDTPATGQGLAFLQTPDAFVRAIRFGPPRTHSQWVRDLIEDPERTRLILVTIPEELPVNEAAEMARAAREKLKVPFDLVVVNAVAPKLFTAKEKSRIDAIEHDPETRGRIEEALEGELSVAGLFRTANEAMARRALHEHHIRRLKARIQKSMIQLPFVYHTDLSLEDLRALGELIVERGAAS